MELREAILTRRSIRKYLDVKVPIEKILEAISYARWAPSAGNIQPWRFVIVTDNEIKKMLSAAALGQECVKEAAAVIVACADVLESAVVYGERGKNLYSIQDVAAATQNLLLVLHDMGLGAIWIGAFHEDAVRRIIGAPSNIRPLALIPVGVPAETPSPPPRKPVDEIVFFERYE